MKSIQVEIHVDDSDENNIREIQQRYKEQTGRKVSEKRVLEIVLNNSSVISAIKEAIALELYIWSE